MKKNPKNRLFTRSSILGASLPAIFTVVLAASARAATATWDGATSTNWNADNWSGGLGTGGAPLANDILQFSGNGGTAGPATVNNFTAATQFGSGTGNAILFTNNGTGGASNTAFSLSGASITLGGNILATSSTAAIQDTISNDLLIGANRQVTANGNHTIALTGAITINAASAVLSFNNAAALSGAGGAINLNATNATVTYNTATATSLALSRAINANSGAHLSNTSTNAAATIIYSGTFTGTAITFVLNGTNTGANDFQSAFGATTILLKGGTGSWTMSGLMSSSNATGLSGVSGNLTLSNDNNSYTGQTIVSAGTLHIATIADYGTNSAVGKGTSGAALRLGNNNTSGILNYTGTGNSTNRTILMGAGTNNVVQTGSATIQNNGSNGGTGLKFTAAAFNPTIANTTANRTLTLGGANTDANEIQGVIQNNTASTGLVAVTKADAGTWTLSGTNTYTGLTTVTGGALSVTGSLASTSTLTVGASGTANFANASQNLGAVSNSNTATSALNFSNAGGTVVLASLTGSGNTRFGSAGTVTGGISTGTVTSVGALNANISGGTITAGGLLTGTVSSGTVGADSLSSTSVTGGTNTITGAAAITSLNGGSTTVGGIATIGTLTSGTASLNGATSSITTLNGGTVNLGSTTLTVGSGSTSGAITGASGGLTVTGALVLNGTNSYGGITSVSTGGDLRVNGTNSGSGAVNVDAGANLGGSGNVIGGINVSGVLAPGNSIESLGGGNLNFLTGSTYAYELSTLGLNGDLAYSSGTLGIAVGTILTLTDLGGSTALAGGSKLTLISSVGAWDLGLFSYDTGAGLTTLADDSTFTLGANIWKFDYNDTLAGSNFTGDTTGATNFVTMTVIPEPDVAALLGGLGTLCLLRRRR